MKQLFLAGALALGLALQGPPASALVQVRQDGDNVSIYTTINAALAVAGPGEEVRITDQGTYSEALTLNNVRLTAVPAGAILTASNPAGNRLVYITGTQPVELSGMRIFTAGGGHGVQIEGNTVPQVTISNTEISAPWAALQVIVTTGLSITHLDADTINIHDSDIGIDVQGSGDTGTVINVTGTSSVSNCWSGNIRYLLPGELNLTGTTVANSGGGAGVSLATAGASTFTATGCTISGNAQDGILGVVNVGAPTGTTWTLSNCTIAGNGQSAIQVYSNENNGLNLVASRCIFRHGSSAEPALDLFKANADLLNCLVDHGGGSHQVLLRYAGGEQARFRHCTFVTTINTVNSISLVDGGSVELTNSIVESAGASINVYPAVGPIFTHDYNLLRGQLNNATASAHEIIAQDPLFVTASAGVGSGDFQLQAASPAVGAGTPLAGVTDDLTGAARPQPVGSLPDLGAYESAFTPVELAEFSLL